MDLWMGYDPSRWSSAGRRVGDPVRRVGFFKISFLYILLTPPLFYGGTQNKVCHTLGFWHTFYPPPSPCLFRTPYSLSTISLNIFKVFLFHSMRKNTRRRSLKTKIEATTAKSLNAKKRNTKTRNLKAIRNLRIHSKICLRLQLPQVLITRNMTVFRGTVSCTHKTSTRSLDNDI